LGGSEYPDRPHRIFRHAEKGGNSERAHSRAGGDIELGPDPRRNEVAGLLERKLLFAIAYQAGKPSRSFELSAALAYHITPKGLQSTPAHEEV